MEKTKEDSEVKAEPEDRLLLPSEVAEMFHVNPKSVTRWARSGKLKCIKTLGGHRRFRESEVRKALEAMEEHIDIPKKDELK